MYFIVFSKDESPTKLRPRGNEDISPGSHVAQGGQKSPFISTTNDKKTAVNNNRIFNLI